MLRAIRWFVRPWSEAGGSRAARIYLLSALLVATVLPAMLLKFGTDDWLWHITASVIFFTPLGIVIFDRLADRLRGGALRLIAWFLGLAVGVMAGYAVWIVFPILPTPSVEVLLRDYRRNMVILTTVLVSVGMATAFFWYRAETFRLQSAAAVARFNVLRDQMQPHFLFNTLNSLKELIADDPEQASAVTQKVADLYRLILQVAKEPTAPLDDELKIVESYLAIEQVRFGERLRFRVERDDEIARAQVPSLMLQTLVENAVKHGICKARDGGEVRVRASRAADGSIAIEVFNTGAPYSPSGSGSGIANTRERLALMYGNADFSIGSDGDGTRVRFVVSGARVGA